MSVTEKTWIDLKVNEQSNTSVSHLHRLFDDARSRLRLAEGLLACLTEARAECESQMARLEKRDAVREVTGRSSLDEKIVDTRRMVESLRRIVEELGERIGVDHRSFAAV